MERARGERAGCGACTIDADGQTHQRRIPHGGLDPGRQHHDAGAGRGNDAVCAAPASFISIGERAIAVTAPDFGDNLGAGGGQEAGCAEIFARGGAGSACARSGE